MPMLGDHVLRDDRLLPRARPNLHEETARQQSIQRFAELEFSHLRRAHYFMYVAKPVDERQQSLLLFSQLDLVSKQLLAIECEHEIEARKHLLDERPLINA